MFCTSLSGNILEGDAQIAAFLIHLGFRLADTEHVASHAHAATAHAAHEQHPQTDDEDKGKDVVENHVEHVIVATVLIAVITREGLGFLGSIHKFFHLVGRADLHFHVRFIARLLGTLVENITDMFRLDVHPQDVLALVDDNLGGIAFIDHRLEV